MSGIVAIFRRDGAEVDPRVLERLHDTLAYRGHDASGRWHDGPVGLGHQALWTTPEAVGEEQPIAVGDVRIALDGRLDNREAFFDALPRGVDPEGISDAHLLAVGYQEYGVECLDRAIGPLVVALWDADRGRLLCARGKTGIRHAFVAETPDLIVVGSDVSTVRAHPEISTSVDESAVLSYLAGWPIPADSTFETGIRQIEPGTRLVIDAGGVTNERYWHPADQQLDLPSDPEGLAEELRERLRVAVEARLRCRGRPGLLLSGGLDSTAVAGIAASDLPDRPTPKPYSLVFERIDDEKMTVEERGRIHDLGERHGLTVTEIVADELGPLSNPTVYDRALANSPCLDPLSPALDRLEREMEADGRRVALTGHGGNALNGTRFAYTDLFRQGRLLRLLTEVRRDWMPTRDLLLWYTLVPAVPQLGDLLVDDDEGPEWLTVQPDEIGPDPGSKPDSASSGGADRFWSAHRQNVYTEMFSVDRRFKLHAGRQMGLARGIEYRMPYYDPRVISFAFSAPPIELISGGAKELFLDAVEDILPPSVREIRKGQHFERFVADGLYRERETLHERFVETTLSQRDYVTDGAPVELLSSFLDGAEPSNTVWWLYATDRWLDSTE